MLLRYTGMLSPRKVIMARSRRFSGRPLSPMRPYDTPIIRMFSAGLESERLVRPMT